jgi:hypothetical protein
MKSVRYGLVGLGMALVSSAIPAHAATQTVGGFSFSTSGQSEVTSPTIPITPFTAGPSSSLTAVKIYFQSPAPTFGGDVGLIPGFAAPPVAFTAEGTPLFSFSGGNGSLTTTGGSVTLTPSSASVQTVATASGSFTGVPVGSISTTGNPSLQSYFSTSPLIEKYKTAYSSATVPSGGSGAYDGGTGLNPTTLSGQFYIQYEYTGAPVPGPVPLLGASAAFAYSRRIRRRIKSSV